MDSTTIWSALSKTIQQRLKERPGGSYVVELSDQGFGAVGAKIIEEAYEFVGAAVEEDEANPHDVTHEAADLLFHFLILLEMTGVPLVNVEQELARRFGVSGLFEKLNRDRDLP